MHKNDVQQLIFIPKIQVFSYKVTFRRRNDFFSMFLFNEIIKDMSPDMSWSAYKQKCQALGCVAYFLQLM